MDEKAILGADALSSAVGFWSGRTIFFNETDCPILTGNLSTIEIAELLEQASQVALERYLKQVAEKIASFDLQNATWTKLMRFVQGCVIHGGVLLKLLCPDYVPPPSQLISWSFLLNHLKESYTSSAEIQLAIESAIDRLPHKERLSLVINELGLQVAGTATMARVDWTKWGTQFADSTSMIRTMINLTSARQVEMQAREGAGKSRPGAEVVNARLVSLIGELTKQVPVTANHFIYEDEASLYVRAMCARGACAAISWALLTLCRHNILFLPLSFYNLRKAGYATTEPDWAIVAKHFALESQTSRIVFQRLIQASSIQSVDDISIGLCHALIKTSIQLQSSATPGIIASIQRYQVENPDKPKFPIADVNFKRRARKKDIKDRRYTPEWFVEQDENEWATVASSFFSRFGGTQETAQGIIGKFYDWCKFANIESPFEVKAINLVNPLDDKDEKTFQYYLLIKHGGNSAAGIWSKCARFFAVVVNALKPLPEYDAIVQGNPFQGLTNPFRFSRKRQSISKTFRKLMPSEHLNAMLATLLDAGLDGKPTFAWAKSAFPQDTAERYNFATRQFEVVWHPARAICLAILLLIPLRGKQARWLDEGLMDQMRWNLGTDSWEKNEHALRNFTYADGQSHEDRYGRASGVLQPVESLLGENSHHIGLYISTNKTQLWNPEARTGYAIPWPDGGELQSSEDPRVRSQGERLGLVYALLKKQLHWLRTYDPDPVPVDFSLDGERYSDMYANRFPKFCPIFRDLTSPVPDAQGKSVSIPITRGKLESIYHALAAETEMRLQAKGWPKEAIKLTIQVRNYESAIRSGYKQEYATRCAYDLHSLRVAGITHLLEMGVPAHIVSEFIAGHMALVMTLHYAKFQPLKLRQKILDAFRESDAIETFEDVLAKKGITGMSSLLVRNQHFSEEEAPPISDLMDSHGMWRYINGGVCPGGSCSEGGSQLLWKGSEIVQEYTSCPVPGGNEACGNCRYFLTGPAFLVPQMLVANAIMLQMRELGRSRKKLWDEKAQVELAAFESPKTASMPTSELAAINGELERIERALEPLILEWCNRYAMFQSSLSMLDRWNDAAHTDSDKPGKLVLVGAGSKSDFSATLDPEGCDFSLVKQIVLQSEMMVGRRMVSDLAEYKLREFVDRILVQKDVRDLLLTISDDRRRRTASLMMAEAISVLAGGDRGVQAYLDGDQPLETTPEQNYVLSELAAAVSKTTSNLDELGSLEPIILLEHFA